MPTGRLLSRQCLANFVTSIALLALVGSAKQSSAQAFTSLHSFCQQTNCPDGSLPEGWLVQGTDGDFYGTTVTGGANGFGTVFKITSGGTLTTLHSFNNSDGNAPAALILAGDGNFYGTASQGGGASCSRGPNGCGTVFRITPGGTLTTLYTFCAQANCTDGYFPGAALVQGRDGNLYGSTLSGGTPGQCRSAGCGTIFKITLAGSLTTLYRFCPQANCQFVSPDGSNPGAALVQGADGNLYGTTESGGSDNGCVFGCGTVFRVTLTGALATLHEFVNSVDGNMPGQILQARDGNFYGVTVGSLFKLTADGSFTTLHNFTFADGNDPVGLLEATDGKLYGVTSQGGNNNCIFGCGTIFKTDAGGVITTLHSFDGSDGSAATGGLVQGTDGTLYGTTSNGGSSTHCQNGCGTAFKLEVGLDSFVETQPTSGQQGAPVNILGTHLTGATTVKFNGTSASFSVVSDTEITTHVPTGATSGIVQVTTPSGTLNSNANFDVLGPFQFAPVTPCRLVDTRNDSPIQGGTSRSFVLPQLGNCNIPATAAAYALNVTVVPNRHRLNYLTIFPTGEVQPLVSTMNSTDGRTKANAAIVPAGNNAVSVYVTDTTDVILDINGYFTSSGQSRFQFIPLTPCRVIDTRGPVGDLGGPYLQGGRNNGMFRNFPVRDSSCIPSGAIAAYSMNFTVAPHTSGHPLSYLTVWPQGTDQPTVSTLNNPTGTVVANAAIVPAGDNGGISVFAYDDTDMIADINGYFAPPGEGGFSFYPAPPCRVVDTRDNHGQPFRGTRTVNVVASPCAPPSGAQAYVFNATVVPPGHMPFLTLWPSGEDQPLASTLNAYDGFVTSNMAIVPTHDGSIDVYADALTHLILDISGYFAP